MEVRPGTLRAEPCGLRIEPGRTAAVRAEVAEGGRGQDTSQQKPSGIFAPGCLFCCSLAEMPQCADPTSGWRSLNFGPERSGRILGPNTPARNRVFTPHPRLHTRRLFRFSVGPLARLRRLLVARPRKFLPEGLPIWGGVLWASPFGNIGRSENKHNQLPIPFAGSQILTIEALAFRPPLRAVTPARGGPEFLAGEDQSKNESEKSFSKRGKSRRVNRSPSCITKVEARTAYKNFGDYGVTTRNAGIW